MLEDVNDEIPLFTEREQETVLEGEPIGTKVTQVNAIDKDGTFPNNQVHLKRLKQYEIRYISRSLYYENIKRDNCVYYCFNLLNYKV